MDWRQLALGPCVGSWPLWVFYVARHLFGRHLLLLVRVVALLQNNDGKQSPVCMSMQLLTIFLSCDLFFPWAFLPVC